MKVLNSTNGSVKFNDKFLIKLDRITLILKTSFVIPTLVPRG